MIRSGHPLGFHWAAGHGVSLLQFLFKLVQVSTIVFYARTFPKSSLVECHCLFLQDSRIWLPGFLRTTTRRCRTLDMRAPGEGVASR